MMVPIIQSSTLAAGPQPETAARNLQSYSAHRYSWELTGWHQSQPIPVPQLGGMGSAPVTVLCHPWVQRFNH